MRQTGRITIHIILATTRLGIGTVQIECTVISECWQILHGLAPLGHWSMTKLFQDYEKSHLVGSYTFLIFQALTNAANIKRFNFEIFYRICTKSIENKLYQYRRGQI